MADGSVLDFPEITSLASDDYIYVIDDSEVVLADKDKKIKKLNAFKGAAFFDNITPSTGTLVIDGDVEITGSLEIQTINAPTGIDLLLLADANFDIFLSTSGTGQTIISNVDINDGTIDDVDIGGATRGYGKFTDVNLNGDLIFDGADKGMIYGAMGQVNVPTTVSVAVVDTDYIVDGMSAGYINGFVFQNSQELKTITPGRYEGIWHISFDVSSVGQEIEGGIAVNGVRVDGSSAHAVTQSATEEADMGAPWPIDLAVNDLVQLVVRNVADTEDIVVEHASLTLKLIAGT